MTQRMDTCEGAQHQVQYVAAAKPQASYMYTATKPQVYTYCGGAAHTYPLRRSRVYVPTAAEPPHCSLAWGSARPTPTPKLAQMSNS